MQAQINLSSTLSFELREALLVYCTDRESHRGNTPASFVTKHPVHFSPEGVPSLGAGTALGKSDLTDLLRQLQGVALRRVPAFPCSRSDAGVDCVVRCHAAGVAQFGPEPPETLY